MNSPFKAEGLILFTGDSINDFDRNRYDPQSFGFGYVGSIASQLWINFEELDLRNLNTGIGGERTSDLMDRWEPDWVCIR